VRPRAALLVIVTLALASLVTVTDDASAQSVRLDKMVVVGDSVLAGFASGGLVRRGRMGQRDAAPSLIARLGGAKLTLPNMSKPGFPPPLVIVDKNHNGVLDPGEVRRKGKGIGFRSKSNDDAQSLAVPGERVSTVLDKIRVTDVIGDAIGGNVKGRDVMKAVIVGLPPDSDPQSQITRALDELMRRKSRIMVWRAISDSAPASSTPVGPPPTSTNVSSRRRRAGSGSRSARSKASRIRRRISSASSRVFSPGASFSHASWPKYACRDPEARIK